MFADTLHRIIKDGDMTLDQIAAALHIAPNSVYAYLCDRWPKLDQFISLLERAPRAAQTKLLTAALAGCPGLYVAYVDASGDLNSDGAVDSRDLAEVVRRNAVEHANLANQLLPVLGGGNITPQQEEEYIALTDRAIGLLVASRIAVKIMTRRRKPARPVTTLGVGA